LRSGETVIYDYWKGFLRWLHSQIEYDRKVLISEFAVISSVKVEEEKVAKMVLLDNFVIQAGLKHRVLCFITQDVPQETTQPTVTVSYINIAKSMERPEDRDKAQVTLGLNTVFRVIMGLLSQKTNIEIDMGILGKLAVFDRTVTH
jgi:hypothetical protein